MNWQANPHAFGLGKIHVVDDKEPKTLCGHALVDCPGSETASVSNCKSCAKAQASRARNEEFMRSYQERVAANQRENDEWWRRYNAYLSSPEWRAKSQAVIRRAQGICEGCGKNRATQAHHLTYRHAFNEFLWELRAVCKGCHDRAHADTPISVGAPYIARDFRYPNVG